MKCRIKKELPGGLNKTAKKVMMDQVIEWQHKYNIDIYSNFLWTLHEEFGFGKERLTRFFKAMAKYYDKFTVGYDFDDTYAERLKLKEECNIDVRQLMLDSGFQIDKECAGNAEEV